MTLWRATRAWVTAGALRLLRRRGASRHQEHHPFAYRMRSWPALSPEVRRASVLRTLARMSCGPITHAWFLRHCGLHRSAADRLLESLLADGSIERIDFRLRNVAAPPSSH